MGSSMEVRKPAVCRTSTNFAELLEIRSVVRENMGAEREMTLSRIRGNSTNRPSYVTCRIETGHPAQLSAEEIAQESRHVSTEAEPDDVDILSLRAA